MDLKVEKGGSRADAAATIKSKEKRQYKTPRLSDFGNVAELTKGTGGSNFDPGQGGFTKNGVG